MPRPSMLTAALDYARQGYRVHPLRPGTKVPLLAAWQTAATTDAETIATWWGEHPTANVGIATGAASNLWVLDVDTGHGPDAKVSMTKLLDAHHALPATMEVETPSGGSHLWFAWPTPTADATTGELPTWRNTKALGPGIDVRAEGGQVAVWPSVLDNGTRYRKPKGARAPLPTWLADLTRYREPASDGVQARLADLTPASASAAGQYGQRAIEAAIGELRALSDAAVPDWASQRGSYRGPSWDDAVFNAACRLLRLAHAEWTSIGEDDAIALVRQHAPSDAGFTVVEHDRILKSARQSVGADAANLPGTLLAPLPLLEVPGADPTRPPAMDPAAYFDKTGFLVDVLAAACDEGDLALGADGLLWRYSEGVYRPDERAVIERTMRLLRDRWRPAIGAAVTDYVRGARDLPRLGDDPHEAYLNLRNGMLDWRTGVLLEHSSAFRSTVQLPILFDPDATCPAFDAFCADVAEPAVLPRLLEVAGYMIAPGNPLQRAVLLYGPGGNGKGTLMRVLESMIGKRNCSAVTLTGMAEGRFDSADLYGKQANIAGDIDPRALKNTANFKAATGGDVIRAERKYGQGFTFTVHATPMFSANALWRSSDATPGYLRRWVVVPMQRRVVGAAWSGEAPLLAEGSGILNRVLPHLRTLMSTGKFSGSLEADEVEAAFAEHSDLVRTWLGQDDAVLDAHPGTSDGNTWRKRDEVFARFKTWCVDNGHGSLASTRFYTQLSELGYVFAQRSRQGRGIYGLRLDSLPGGMRPLSVSLPVPTPGQP